MGKILLIFSVLWLCFLQACQPSSLGNPVDALGEEMGHFDYPQGVLFVGDYAVVTNTAFDPETLGFGEGFITVVDVESFEVVNQIPVSAPNPQKVIRVGNDVVVLCTGTTFFDGEQWLNVAISSGALDRFPVESLAVAEGPRESVELPGLPEDPRIGGMGSLALSEGGEAIYLTSGLSATLFKVDVPTWTLTRGPENPIQLYEHEGNDTLTVSTHSDGFLRVASFNSDRVYTFDPSTDSLVDPEGIDVGETEDLEGLIQTVELPSGEELGLFSIANTLSHWSEPGDVATGIGAVGPIANWLEVAEDVVFVVNSGVNNLSRYHWETGMMDEQFSVFDVGAGPWEMDADTSRDLGVVSLNQSQAVVFVQLSTGKVMEEIR